ncbi:conserved virulence factor C family protein [Paenibacillus guangzhouensis]|uniref:conserved virulence factor C family protein n=1 Tax=Paenibacillus guangzhouensis TaxID=1473112 RepID=UPI001266F3AD|nr:conserved virulence factor C family protein [Paenibacillus guangzhouensis]
MKLISIEPTPSPNSMKLHLDERLAPGVRKTYTLDNERSAPPFIQRMLAISGVKSVFHTADFVALDRHPRGDWAAILGEVRDIFGTADGGAALAAWDPNAAVSYGEAQVFVQYFRSIPMQIRVKAGVNEERIGLGDRFTQAVTAVASATLIKERRLVEFGVRYGELADIAREVEQELEAAYPPERLQGLVTKAIALGASEEPVIEERGELTDSELEALLRDADWRVRYAALDRMQPSLARLPLLAEALRDAQSSIRRLAVVYLGELRAPEAMPLLFAALRDSSAAVRRTAGDTLSDLGDPAAIGPMIEALSDSNKLVRWRAARFLYEAGDESALSALQTATADPEFEVSLQAKMAVERIESGEAAAGTVWQQMARRGDSE